MFHFHQNNSQLLFHVIFSPWGAGAFSRGFTKILALQCGAFSRALKFEKLNAPLFPGPGGAGDANEWCIIKSTQHAKDLFVLFFFTFVPTFTSQFTLFMYFDVLSLILSIK